MIAAWKSKALRIKIFQFLINCVIWVTNYVFSECQCNAKGVLDNNMNCSEDDGRCTCKESHSGDSKCKTCGKTYFGDSCERKYKNLLFLFLMLEI